MSAEKVKTPIAAPATVSMTQAVFGLAKSAIGAGALTLPVKFADIGLVPGLAALVFSSAVCTATLHFLARLAAHTDCSSYFSLGRMALGPVAGEAGAMAALALFLLGGLIFYIAFGARCLLAGMRVLSGNGDLLKGQDWILMVVVASCIYPMACLRDMRSLGKASIIGMVCMFYVLGLAIAQLVLKGLAPAEQITTMAPFKLDLIVNTFSGMLFAFVNHFTMVSTVPVLEDPSSRRRFRLTAVSSSVVIGFYLLFSLAGYLSLGNSMLFGKDTILDVTQAPGAMANAFGVAQLAVALMLILSYPLLCDPLRAVVENAIAKMGSGSSRVAQAGGQKASTAPIGFFSARNLAVTAVLVAIPAIVGATCERVAGKILELFTALSGSLLVFIFPAVYFLRLSSVARFRVSATEQALAYFAIAFGLVLMVLGTYYGAVNVWSFFANQK